MAMAYMAIVYPVYPVRLLLSACMSKKPQFLAKKCHSQEAGNLGRGQEPARCVTPAEPVEMRIATGDSAASLTES